MVVIIDCVAEILIPLTVLQEILMVDKWLLLPAYHRIIYIHIHTMIRILPTIFGSTGVGFGVLLKWMIVAVLDRVLAIDDNTTDDDGLWPAYK